MDEALVRELRRLAPFETAADARLALISSLEALGFLLPDHLLREVAAALPPGCASALASGQAATRTREGGAAASQNPVASGQALERVQEVYAVLARRLPADLVADLIRELPAQFASAFAAADVHAPPRAERLARGESRRHLSEARSDSLHSLAGGRPPGAQQDSVAAANPHGDTKLSSKESLGQRTALSAAGPRRGAALPEFSQAPI